MTADIFRLTPGEVFRFHPGSISPPTTHEDVRWTSKKKNTLEKSGDNPRDWLD